MALPAIKISNPFGIEVSLCGSRFLLPTMTALSPPMAVQLSRLLKHSRICGHQDANWCWPQAGTCRICAMCFPGSNFSIEFVAENGGLLYRPDSRTRANF